jgi:hypothetical protein
VLSGCTSEGGDLLDTLTKTVRPKKTAARGRRSRQQGVTDLHRRKS